MDTTFSKNSKSIFNLNMLTIGLILIFVVSPIGNFTSVSTIFKIIILFILGYTIFLNIKQVNMLNNMSTQISTIATNTTANNATNDSSNDISDNITQFVGNINKQLNANKIGSYIFIAFLVVMFFFILKSFVV